jgi:hypothetical protein
MVLVGALTPANTATRKHRGRLSGGFIFLWCKFFVLRVFVLKTFVLRTFVLKTFVLKKVLLQAALTGQAALAVKLR